MFASLALAAALATSGAAPETPPPPQAAATPAAPAPAPVAAPDKAKEEKLVCKYEMETGSRFSKKVCMTQAQAKARRDEARKAVSDIQANSAIAPGVGP